MAGFVSLPTFDKRLRDLLHDCVLNECRIHAPILPRAVLEAAEQRALVTSDYADVISARLCQLADAVLRVARAYAELRSGNSLGEPVRVLAADIRAAAFVLMALNSD